MNLFTICTLSDHVTYLYFIRTVIHFFIRDLRGECGSTSVHLFDI